MQLIAMTLDYLSLLLLSLSDWFSSHHDGIVSQSSLAAPSPLRIKLTQVRVNGAGDPTTWSLGVHPCAGGCRPCGSPCEHHSCILSGSLGESYYNRDKGDQQKTVKQCQKTIDEIRRKDRMQLDQEQAK
jgi:hypothetical protein